MLATAVLAFAASSGAATAATFHGARTPVHVRTVVTTPVHLGQRMQVRQAGRITALRVYRPVGARGTSTGSLWDAATGRRLALVRFGQPARAGWQMRRLVRAVPVRAGQFVVVAYRIGAGTYAASPRLFTRTITRGPLRVWRATSARPAGLRTVNRATVLRPTRSGGAASLFADVVFAPSSTDPKTPTPPLGRPGPDNTGVPAGVTLQPYTGPCTITSADTVIDARAITCDLDIRAANVTISRSRITGTIATDDAATTASFTIVDSEVDAGDQPGTGIGAANFTVRRVEVRGGNRSINCWRDCLVEHSWVHGQFTDETGVHHESGIRMGAGGTIRHNTIVCDAPDVPPDAGCSAGLTGYGDFAAVTDMLVQGNYFPVQTGGFCAYGGSSRGKPFSDGARDIRFIDNVFERAGGRPCGFWGAITDFDPDAPGNAWTNNTWSDGGAVTP